MNDFSNRFVRCAVGLTLTISSTQAVAESLRDTLLAIPMTENLGGETTRPVATGDAFTFVAGNAAPDAKAMFSFGNQMFTTVWTPAPGPQPATDGLGPLFNRESCLDCHIQNGRGAPPDGPEQKLETSLVRISIPGTDKNGGPNPVPVYGDQIQDRAIDGVPAEATPQITWTEQSGTYGDGTVYKLRKPSVVLANPQYGPLPEDLLMSFRVANPMIGLGLLQAVPRDTLDVLADPDDADGDGISGRVNIVFDVPSRSMREGRFGWKANNAGLRNQNAGAALGDMGISTPVMPIDLCLPGQDACAAAAKKARAPDGPEMSKAFFDRLDVYSQLIAVPKQRNGGADDVRRGEQAFRDMGCAACHMPTLITGAVEGRPEISDQTIHPFTDLLIHDMGEGLADGRPDWLASGSEWRTPPLWGIGLTEKVSGHTFFLHDGRARDLAEAILWHGGEAETTKESFRTADEVVRNDLIAFLNSL